MALVDDDPLDWLEPLLVDAALGELDGADRPEPLLLAVELEDEVVVAVCVAVVLVVGVLAELVELFAGVVVAVVVWCASAAAATTAPVRTTPPASSPWLARLISL